MSGAHGCPFHSEGHGVSLGEIAGIVRCRDRSRMKRAIDQLVVAIEKTPSLEDAKGEALTFLGIVTAAMLENGGGREMHRVQLEAARLLDALKTNEEIAEEAVRVCMELAAPICQPIVKPAHMVIDHVLEYLTGHLSGDLRDTIVASRFHLSVSHFRFLFSHVTGQSYSKYVLSLRLERAKEMIVSDPFRPISRVSRACGFVAAPHFTRAFHKRFGVGPNELRRNSLATQTHAIGQTVSRE